MTVRELFVRMGFTFDEAKAKQAESTIEGIREKASGLVTTIAGIGAAIGVAFGIHEISQIADEWTSMEARVGLVTKSAEEQAQVLESIYDISNRTRQEYTATADLYQKLGRSSKEFGATQDQILAVVETVNEGLVVGGASTQEAKATILQLGQALSSGRLQGDELKSLDENASMLMQEVAKAYGTTIGNLKQMGAEGKLTSEGVFNAILKAKGAMDTQFEKMPLTIGQAIQVSKNKFGRFISDIGKETGGFKAAASGIDWVVDRLDSGVRRVVKALGGWNQVFKLAGLLMLAFGAGMVALKWGAITSGIRAVAVALRTFVVSNPYVLAIAAAVAILALALEDVYTWIEGGDSLIGEFIGPWDEFKSQASQYITPLLDGLSRLWEGIQQNIIPLLYVLKDAIVETFYAFIAVASPVIGWVIDQFLELTNNGQVLFDILLAAWNGMINGIILALQFLTQIFTGEWGAAIDTAIQFLNNLLTTAISIMQQIGQAIANYVLNKLGWAGQMIAKFAGLDLSQTVSLQNAAGAGRGGGVMNQQIDVNVTVPPGTPTQQASFLQGTAENSYGDAYSQLGTNLSFGPGMG